MAAEFMQYRRPVGRGPSLKTWPRCALQSRHETAVRSMPKLWSRISTMFSCAIGCQKLGHPVPDSNLVSELKTAVSQHTHRKIPFSSQSAYLFEHAPRGPPLR